MTDTLKTLDDQIKTATSGASDLYGLLSQLASQNLGIPRSAFVPPVAEPAPEQTQPVAPYDPDEHDKHGRHKK
jgi:hypothetical protein